jgi:DNA-binding NtrC family response regulator
MATEAIRVPDNRAVGKGPGWEPRSQPEGVGAKQPTGRVLIVDDDPGARSALQALLESEGYQVATAGNAFRGLELLGEFRPQVVLTDLRLPGLDGLAFMEKVNAASPATRVVVMTACGSVDLAVEAMKRGADDFLEKPFDLGVISRKLRASMERAALLEEAGGGAGAGAAAATCLGVVGAHPSMRAVLERAQQVASSRATVLLTGESGTGKGLLAETIHRLSGRAQAPFVEVSCAALAESLLESELFGHERGAFTGAVSRHEGRFKRADGGTLFLDEIGSVPLATQVKLLGFLQTRRFERVGGRETLTVDVRLMAATNRDLREEVAAGRFREDLYYRLNVVPIELPPLRLRRSDVPALAAAFLARFAAENERRIGGFSGPALERLLGYDWPGNVRELEHAVEHATVMARGRLVTPQDLPDWVAPAPADPLAVAIPGSTLAEIERAAILGSMLAAGGRATEAAAMLGISKSKIYYRLRDYGRVSSGEAGGADVTADPPAPRSRRQAKG